MSNGDHARDAPKLRADAARNRAVLLAAAHDAFTNASRGTPVALEAVARAAGVGIGTLYRHFPTRESLVEALYASELDEVVASAPQLLADHTAFEALRLWMGRYSRFVATKRGMADAVLTAITSGAISTNNSRERITSAIAVILAAGTADGTIRPNVDPGDLTALLFGISVTTDAGDTERVTRMLDLVTDGLRPAPERAG